MTEEEIDADKRPTTDHNPSGRETLETSTPIKQTYRAEADRTKIG